MTSYIEKLLAKQQGFCFRKLKQDSDFLSGQKDSISKSFGLVVLIAVFRLM